MDNPQRTKCSRSGASWGSVCTRGISLHVSMGLLGPPGVSELHPSAEELNQQIKQQRTDIPDSHLPHLLHEDCPMQGERRVLALGSRKRGSCPSLLYLCLHCPTDGSTTFLLLKTHNSFPSLHSSVTLNPS